MSTRLLSLVKIAILVVGLSMFLSAGTTHAARQGEDSPSAKPASQQTDDSRLNKRLLAAKKDLEVLPSFAEYFNDTGDSKALLQLQEPFELFLKKHVDKLVAQCTEDSSIDTIMLTAEVMYLKTRLFMTLGRDADARTSVAEMKSRFGSQQNLTVTVSGTTTTLNEMILELDEELENNAPTRKKE
jgi:hypothetical protein